MAVVKGGEGNVRRPWEEEKTGRKNPQEKGERNSLKPEEEELSGQSRITQKILSREDTGDEGSEEAQEAEGDQPVTGSARMGNVREKSVSQSEDGGEDILRHSHYKKQIRQYSQKEKRRKQQLQEEPAEEKLFSGEREQIQRKQKQRRLSFEAEGKRDSFVYGSGAGFGRKAAACAAGTAVQRGSYALHRKVDEAEEENSGVQAAHAGERLAEQSVRIAASSRLRQQKAKGNVGKIREENFGAQRLRFGEEPVKAAQTARQEAKKKSVLRKFYQKMRYRRMYAAAKKEGKAVEQAVRSQRSITAKAAAVVKETFRRNSKVLLGVGILGLLLVVFAASVASCSAFIQGSAGSIISTTYASTDVEIYEVEDAYTALEQALQRQINSIESRYSQYDEFRYQIDEISHNPYHLISYLTVKYGEFTYEQVEKELEEIFEEQYSLTLSGERATITETKTVRVGESLGQVVTSGYCNCAACCGQWAGGPTASGVYPTASHTIAVDASQPFVPIGTHVIMNGVEYVVEDTGNFAQYGVEFDVYYGDHASAQAHGHQTWEAYLADSNGEREIEVTTTETVNQLSVTLANHNLDTVLRNRLNREQEEWYDAYNATYGNRNYLFALDTLPSYGSGDYSIPPEALSDERFARMYNEAIRYLGVPYVWGGYSPSGFDCSGFVSWVINHCGNGWDYGRLTADGLLSACAYVSPEDAKPGDLIFFERTYNTSGASHVGIYLGNGQMIHCGKPVQITSLSQYWTDHFLQFGRLP